MSLSGSSLDSANGKQEGRNECVEGGKDWEISSLMPPCVSVITLVAR
jgi:hypothetical protein